jgi:hypothetical protein
MKWMLLPALAVALAVGFGLAPQPATTPPTQAEQTTTLSVRGTGLNDTALKLSDLAAMPRRTISVIDKDGDAKYEGVLIQDILTRAGMTFGQSLRGPRLRDYLLAEAGDGYAVIYALPEISTEFSDRAVIVADRVNGAAISGRDGPLRIIVSDEKKHARWVRNVISLTVRTDAPQLQVHPPGE